MVTANRLLLLIVVLCVLTVTANMLYGYKHQPLSRANLLPIRTEYLSSSNGKDTGNGNNKASLLSSAHEKNITSLTHISAQEIDVARRWSRKVLFIWCGNEDFTFMHYVSARSVVSQTNPSQVIFAYKTLPNVKPTGYNTWYSELNASFPFWKEQQFKNICVSNHPSANDVETVATDVGCPVLFASTSTVFRSLFEASDPVENVNAYNASSGIGYHLLVHINTSAILRNQTFKPICPQLNDISDNRTTSQKQCFSFGPNVRFYPENVMYLATPAARDIRQVFYGSPDMPYPARDNNTSAPNIAHYVWIGSKPIPFQLYVSVLSALFVAGVERVCIHVDHPPYGEHWQRMQQDVAPDRIVIIPREKQELVYGQQLRPVPHKADVIKSSIMYEYGGIMMDIDVMFTQKLPTHLFYYDAVLGLGLIRHGHPNIISMGISISKPHSEMARLWLNSEREFHDKDWNWNCGRVTYKMWERKPTLAKLDQRIYMVCMKDSKCIPFWTKDQVYKRLYSIKSNYMTNEEKMAGAYSLHFVKDPFISLDLLINKDKEISGLIGRMILRAAGVIKPTEGLVP